MTEHETRKDTERSAPAWLVRAGTQAWLFVGLVVAAAVAAVVMAALSGIVVPLVIAVVIGMLCRPLVDWAARHRVPPALASLGTMLLILAVVLVLAVVVINGLVRQMPLLLDQAAAGLDDLGEWIAGLGAGTGPRFDQWLRARTRTDEGGQGGRRPTRGCQPLLVRPLQRHRHLGVHQPPRALASRKERPAGEQRRLVPRQHFRGRPQVTRRVVRGTLVWAQ